MRKVVKCELVIDDSVRKIFSTSTGGSSRQWIKRYRNMIDRHQFMIENATNKTKRDELKGYEKCLMNFLIIKEI